VFKKGDLFKFNESGINLFKYITGSVGIIVSDATAMYEYGFHSQPERTEYLTYDILVCGQLFKDIPEEFLDRIVKNEKNIERMEKLPE
tara:strand:+ start:360 stop:623 length:264 start_codon:yes stop_codon:yes gene_type:complete